MIFLWIVYHNTTTMLMEFRRVKTLSLLQMVIMEAWIQRKLTILSKGRLIYKYIYKYYITDRTVEYYNG